MRASKVLTCYEHFAILRHGSQIEKHHPATRKIESGFTVPIYGNDHRVVTVRSGRWIADVKIIKAQRLREEFGRFFSLRDVERQMVERSGPVDEVVLDLLQWLSVDHAGWEQEFERWRESRDRRDA
jgi:hypothetical protein